MPRHRALDHLQSLLRGGAPGLLGDRLEPRHDGTVRRIPTDRDAVDARWSAIAPDGAPDRALLDERARALAPAFARNIENYVGALTVPVGVAGPVRVNGSHAAGDYVVPLATTEAALVASINRGASVITASGGCAAVTTNELVSRAPGFAFATLRDAGAFVLWVLDAIPHLRHVTESTTRHGRLADVRVSLEGNHVYLVFDFHTGDASGQNMVTIATQAICAYIADASPVPPLYGFLEANHSGDKKASAQSFTSGRGRSVTAEVHVPRALVLERLHTTPEMLARYFTISAIGGVLSGTIGVQGHYANALAALYLATGQDVACVAESAVGVTRLEATADGLYAAVTLPNLLVGTVGGGTGLPAQRACLATMGLAGEGHASALAEVCAAVALAGELSITAALCAGEFATAHARFARGTPAAVPTAPVVFAGAAPSDPVALAEAEASHA
ncbi:MAG: 3-hydroxy-3-methylglutaryl-CoA reductase [Gemmatimonadetes bacterium]|nr:3-hydroxy-3-methylglutaryl-CoA reductase [Gemmatimonadota bacterium]